MKKVNLYVENNLLKKLSISNSSVLIVSVDSVQEILKKMRLKVFSIIDALKRKCEGTTSLSNVRLMSK